MPGMLSQISERQSRFKGRIDRVLRELAAWQNARSGKIVGLAIPPDVRSRIDRQCRLWNATATKQLIGTCIVLGLRELEELGAIHENLKTGSRKDDEPLSKSGVGQYLERMKKLTDSR